jgi:four helix bundle protein
MNPVAEELKERTLRFALDVLRFCQTIPHTWEGRFVADQLFRASARTAAHYRAASRARSHRDFVSKLGMAVEESDESVFWLTLVARAAMSESADQKELLAEGRELLAIFIASSKKASGNQQFAICNYLSPSMISSSASGPGRTLSSGSVASGSSTRFSCSRKSSRSGSM